jgi:hypothetical protein
LPVLSTDTPNIRRIASWLLVIEYKLYILVTAQVASGQWALDSRFAA